MPVMSAVEQLWCRGGPWRAFTGRAVFPWALRGVDLIGEVLEIGSGAGANGSELLRRYPRLQLSATDLDPAMVAAARRRLERFASRCSAAVGWLR